MLLLATLLGAMAVALPAREQPTPSVEEQLRAAVEETDRIDPGWRPEQIQARRPALADDVNSAVCVREVCERLPPDWPEARLVDVEEQPPRLLRPEEIDLVREELAPAAAALEEARRLAELPHGRLPAYVASNPSAFVKACEGVRLCARLLEWQAWLQAQEQDADGALRSLRSMVHAGAALDEEPQPLAQMTRLSVQDRACATLAVVLAQTQPGDEALQQIEQVLRREQAHPLALWLIRGERTSQLRRLSREAQPAVLRFCSRAADIVRLPVELQGPLLEGLQAPAWRRPADEQKLFRDVLVFGRAWLVNRAVLSCTLTALAVERYRLRRGRWPEQPAVPPDPFDGRPLRYRRLADGVVIHSVGPEGKEAGFRLWGPRDRRQKPAAGRPPGDVFGLGPAKDGQSCFPHRHEPSS